MVSKNRKIAKDEWRKKQEALKKGQVPTEYKEWLGPKEKKYTAMSKFINDRSLYDEYQNRFRADESTYVPMKKVNHKKMKEDTENIEDRFLKVLQHDEQKPSVIQGRQRPITATQPTKVKNKQVKDLAESSSDDDSQVFKQFDKFSNKEYKFNKDLDVSHSQQSQDNDVDDVIDLMNDKILNQQIKANKNQGIFRYIYTYRI